MLKEKSLELDGSMLEGGGAIIRVSTALSAVTGKPIKVFKIRAKRCNPGLRPQHLNGVKAIAELCNSETNLTIGCKELEFYPKKIQAKNININIGTAGSISLLLYSLLIPSLFAEKQFKIKIIGGTDTKMAPPTDYFKYVLLENLKKFGLKSNLEIKRRGYYPKGNGLVEVNVVPGRLKEIDLVERGKIIEIKGISHASEFLKKAKVAERQAKSARKSISEKYPGVKISIKSEYVNTLCPGSGVDLFGITENSVIGGNSLGERGKPSEIVGREAAKMLLKELDSNCPVDVHLGDQLIPYLALFKGHIKVSKISMHAKTNIWVCERFFGKIFSIRDNTISCR